MAKQPLPTGMVTFLFTDIQGSTLLWESHPEQMAVALQLHNAVLRQAIQGNGGAIFKVIGDSFQAAFPAALEALNAAVEAQRGLASAPWNELGPLMVRMGLHAGEAELDPDSDEYLVSHTKNRTARIMSAGHGGQILFSSAVMELLDGQCPQGAILKDMGEHFLKGMLHPEHLFQAILPNLNAEFPPLITEDPLSNLPIPATLFLDREKELANITTLLKDPASRLITLTGIGGSGKTRLSIEAARQGQLIYRNVYFVGLAAITSLDDLILQIADVWEYTFTASPGNRLPVNEAKTQLLRYLADKKGLLVLDNFEQLSCCVNFLAELVSAAPGIKLIVTSRERLNLEGEWVQEISGLSFPDLGIDEAIQKFDAVQLFINSAERTSQFKAEAGDWLVIARICQLLEGMPLGIEMAAAWTKMITCQEILREIEGNLDFLAATWRDVPERQQTLRAVFETSWRLLNQEEQDALCRLAVFRGGFRHDAASQVAGASLFMLSSLVDKSFIRRIASGRFEIHPVLQPYALEKLEANSVFQAEVHTWHAQYYSEWLGRQMFAKLKGAEQLEALALGRAEMQNLRAACQVLVAQRDFKRLDQVLPPLILFYEMNNQRVETQELVKLLEAMEQLLRQELEPATQTKPAGMQRSFLQALLGITLAALHNFSFIDFHTPANTHLQEESLQLVQFLADTETKAYAILLSCRGPGNLTNDQRLDCLQQSFAIFKGINDPWGAALAQLIWADYMNFGDIDLDLALPGYQASLRTFEEAQNLWGQALCLFGMAALERKNGHMEEAYRLGSKAMEMFCQYGNYERMAEAHHALAEMAIAMGNRRVARHHFEANLKYFVQLGDKTRQLDYQELLRGLDEQES